MTYGVQPTGFVRKPLSVILADIERSMITEFGPGVIQTPQSPLGQLNGLMSDLIAELWERAEDLYQSYDPDQAEGVRLDTLAKIRLLSRAEQTDLQLRQSITNRGEARVDIQDLAKSLLSIEGVSFVSVYVNDTGTTDANGVQTGTVAAAVIGGDDQSVGEALRRHVVPGVNTFGNAVLETTVEGFCRSLSVIRPIQVPVTVSLKIRTRKDRFGCPPPSTLAIREGLVADWAEVRRNGDNLDEYRIRSLIECRFSTVEIVEFLGSRDDGPYLSEVEIGFIEMAELSTVNISVEVVA